MHGTTMVQANRNHACAIKKEAMQPIKKETGVIDLLCDPVSPRAITPNHWQREITAITLHRTCASPLSRLAHAAESTGHRSSDIRCRCKADPVLDATIIAR